MRTLALLSTLSILALPACGNLNFYSDADLEPLSVQAYEEASQQHQIITSGQRYELVQRVARGITQAANRNYPWQARLLKADNVPNAFCLPNGRIAIYTGILEITKNADGLAAVMGHEVAHAILRHGGKRMTQSTLTALASEALSEGLDMSEMDQDTHDLVISAFGIGGEFLFTLPYSRDHESEADIEGIRYAIRAGFDPWEAPKLWERMAKLGSSGPEWMSTHPDPLNRAKRLREVIPRIIEEERNWRPSGVNQ